MCSNSNAMITIMTVVEHLFMTQFWHICKSIESNFETLETCSNSELTHLNHRLKLPKRSSNLHHDSVDHGETRHGKWTIPNRHIRCQRPTRLKLPLPPKGGALKNWTAEVSTKRNQTYQVLFLGESKGFCHFGWGFSLTEKTIRNKNIFKKLYKLSLRVTFKDPTMTFIASQVSLVALSFLWCSSFLPVFRFAVVKISQIDFIFWGGVPYR